MGSAKEIADDLRESDPAKAINLYRIAADEGDVDAASSLGYMLMTGEGTEIDLKESERYLRIASDGGNATAMCNLGTVLTERDPQSALELYEMAGRLGNITGMRNAAVMLRTGTGVPIDMKRAIAWLEKASEIDVASMSILAHILRTGENVPADKPRAAELYRKAAEAGDADSQYDLAMMLDSGDGIDADRAEAEKWFRRSAEQGDNDARLCLGGILYERGDFSEAESVFMDAALDGDVKAMYNLAQIYTSGCLGTADYCKAEEWLSVASDKGFAYAQTMLGTMFLDHGMDEDAIELFRSAAEQNEPVAKYNLGALALSGMLKMDEKETIRYLVEAANSGVAEAGELLSKLSGSGLI